MSPLCMLNFVVAVVEESQRTMTCTFWGKCVSSSSEVNYVSWSFGKIVLYIRGFPWKPACIISNSSPKCPERKGATCTPYIAFETRYWPSWQSKVLCKLSNCINNSHRQFHVPCEIIERKLKMCTSLAVCETITNVWNFTFIQYLSTDR